MTLSEEVRRHLIDHEIYLEGEAYGLADLEQLGVDPQSAFADFYTHVDEPTLAGANGHEIDNIIWMISNSSYLDERKTRLDALGLSSSWVPMDAFEGGGGYFYNVKNHGIYEIELGESLQAVVSGEAKPTWTDFDAFVRYFYAIDNASAR